MIQTVQHRKAPYHCVLPEGSPSISVETAEGDASRCSWHCHPEHQLSWVESGSGHRVVGDRVEPIEPGELTLLGPNLPHLWRYDGESETRALVVHFRADFAGRDFFLQPEMRPVGALLEEAKQGTRFSVASSCRVRASMERLAEAEEALERTLALLEILGGLSRDKERVALCSSSLRPASARYEVERLQQVLAFVEANLAESIDREAAARRANLTPSAFSRFFRQTTGRTFQSFVSERRIQYACRLLAESGCSITEAAVESGFASPTSFNRCFRRVMGRCPTEYRGQLARLKKVGGAAPDRR